MIIGKKIKNKEDMMSNQDKYTIIGRGRGIICFLFEQVV